MNKFQQLQNDLIKTSLALSKRLGKTPDIEEANAILREIREVNHRATLAGSLAFSQLSEKIGKDIDKLRATSTELQSDIKTLKTVKKVIENVGKFLAVVDDVLDQAKALLL
jgi:hypothetical protein